MHIHIHMLLHLSWFQLGSADELTDTTTCCVYPILSYPILSCPILSSPLLSSGPEGSCSVRAASLRRQQPQGVRLAVQ